MVCLFFYRYMKDQRNTVFLSSPNLLKIDDFQHRLKLQLNYEDVIKAWLDLILSSWNKKDIVAQTYSFNMESKVVELRFINCSLYFKFHLLRLSAKQRLICLAIHPIVSAEFVERFQFSFFLLAFALRLSIIPIIILASTLPNLFLPQL